MGLVKVKASDFEYLPPLFYSHGCGSHRRMASLDFDGGDGDVLEVIEEEGD